ncbi:MAG: ACT domain-containing protein [Actinomycetota bacterium]|nr:ACT domain-containing protein [Actinomycetota bacterium]
MTEFTLKLANRPGQLAALAQVLDDAGVNIEALAAFGVNEEGYVRLVVDDAAGARRAFHEAGFSLEEREILSTLLPNRPGSFAAMARSLAEAGINIDAAYLLRSNPDGYEFAIAVNELEPARKRLS